MSEYNFEYKCISTKNISNVKEDKVLQFMVYQDYKEKGNMVLQVYIPEELREKVSFVKLYFDDHAVDFPKITGDKNKDRKLWSKALTFNSLKSGKISTLNEENCIYIRPKEEMSNQKKNKKRTNGCLSGTGLIGFILEDDPEGENGVPSVEHVYKFVTNFSKKETISYQILEYKRHIVVEVTYPKLSKDIRLNILAAKGHKPLTNYDRLTGEYVLDEKNEKEKYVITLKKTKRLTDSVSVSINTNKAQTHDFRLVFEDDLNNNLYRLCDESINTLEDAKLSRQHKAHKGKGSKKNVMRCPFCGGALTKYKGKGKNKGIFTCDGERIADVAPGGKGKMIVCKKANAHFGLKPEGEYMILPDEYGEKPVLNIALAGKRRSGKTIFISSLINVEKQPGDESIYKASPFILNTIINWFDKSARKRNLGAKEIEVLTLVQKDLNSYSITKKYLTFRTNEQLDSRYVMSVGQQVERQTDAGNRVKLSYNPVGFDMRKLGFINFYDVPGECFKENATDKVRAFDIANGIILIIDGDDSQYDNPFQKCYDALNKLKELTTNNKDLADTPIAIVFSKLDLKLSTFYDQNDPSELEQYKRCFDENCHLVRENVVDIFPMNAKYHNSELEKHIDCSSYEIEHYLKSLDPENALKIAEMKENFTNIKFFSCSALGSDNVLVDVGATKAKILFKPKRLRLELPIVWLMYKQGLIRK